MTEEKKSKKAKKSEKVEKPRLLQVSTYDPLKAALCEYNELVTAKASREKIAAAFAKVKEAEKSK